MVTHPTAIDLFSGCGGLTLGLKQAGFNVIAGVEIETFAAETYEMNHPEVDLWQEDIQAIDPTDLMQFHELLPGELDLLAGCPPCQGFSTLTTLNGKHGTDDPRNDLVFQFLRFVEALCPKAIMLENVPGLAKDQRFTKLCHRLEKLGYITNSAIHDAVDFGVPQRRKRLILLAGFGYKIPFAEKSKKRRTVRDAIAHLPVPGNTGDPIHDFPENRTDAVRQRIAQIPHDGGSRLDLPEEAQLPCHRKCNGFKDIYGRMKWDDAAPTMTSGCFNPSKGRFLHPDQNRAITMREASLLQGFPIEYQFPRATNKSAVATLIGNALPPSFVRDHAKNARLQIRLRATTNA